MSIERPAQQLRTSPREASALSVRAVSATSQWDSDQPEDQTMADPWETFVGKQNPWWFLRVVDQAVAAGRWSSRLEAFTDHARFALSVLEPGAVDKWTSEQLGRTLLKYAESCEQPQDENSFEHA